MSGPIDNFLSPGPLKVRRFFPMDLIEGKPSRRRSFNFLIQASIQRLSSRDLKQLPEGDRTSESIKIYTEHELKAGEEQCLQEPDEICYRERWYQIHKVEFWDQLLPHYKAIALLRENDQDDDEVEE